MKWNCLFSALWIVVLAGCQSDKPDYPHDMGFAKAIGAYPQSRSGPGYPEPAGPYHYNRLTTAHQLLKAGQTLTMSTDEECRFFQVLYRDSATPPQPRQAELLLGTTASEAASCRFHEQAAEFELMRTENWAYLRRQHSVISGHVPCIRTSRIRAGVIGSEMIVQYYNATTDYVILLTGTGRIFNHSTGAILIDNWTNTANFYEIVDIGGGMLQVTPHGFNDTGYAHVKTLRNNVVKMAFDLGLSAVQPLQ